MPYWRACYHLVWATFERQPIIKPAFESDLYRIMAAQCHQLGGHCYIINRVADHVHLVTTIPPSISIAEVVKQVKGTSSRVITEEKGVWFRWQKGYGIFSISKKNVPHAIRYVKRQKEHHAAGTAIPIYETYTAANDGPQ